MDQSNNLERLIRQAVKGDEDAFAKLLQQLRRPILYLFHRATSRAIHHHTREDLLQEIEIELWGELPNFEYKGYPAFLGWLGMIIRSHPECCCGRETLR